MANYRERLKTNEIRFAFVKIFEKNDDGKYTCVLMIDKSKKKLIEAIKGAITKVHSENAGMLKTVKVSKCLEILHDADEEGGLAERYPEFEGHMYMNVSSRNKVPVLHKIGGALLTTEEEFHSGDFGMADLTFYPYGVDKNKGVGCAINSILKTRDGDDLSGGATNAMATWQDELDIEE